MSVNLTSSQQNQHPRNNEPARLPKIPDCKECTRHNPTPVEREEREANRASRFAAVGGADKPPCLYAPKSPYSVHSHRLLLHFCDDFVFISSSAQYLFKSPFKDYPRSRKRNTSQKSKSRHDTIAGKIFGGKTNQQKKTIKARARQWNGEWNKAKKRGRTCRRSNQKCIQCPRLTSVAHRV